MIKELKGVYQGPKNVKASGKAAGTKKKKAVNKKEAAKVVKKTPKRRPNTGPSLVSSDGHAPLRKKVVSPE